MKQLKLYENGCVEVWDDETNHRETFIPNQPLSDFVPDELKAQIQSHWTPERVQAYVKGNTPKAHEQTENEAVQIGLNYANRFFNQWQLQDLTALLALGTEQQRMRIASVYQWMNTLKMQAMLQPSTFHPSGEPPFTYRQIIEAGE